MMTLRYYLASYAGLLVMVRYVKFSELTPTKNYSWYVENDHNETCNGIANLVRL